MKMDPKEDKDTLEKMLATLKSDDLWDANDPYEATCIAGDLKRYHFGFASSAQATVFEQKATESTTISTDNVKMVGAPALQDSAGTNIQVLVKLENAEEQKEISEKVKELNKVEKDVTGLIVSLRKMKSLLAACKKPEGAMF